MVLNKGRILALLLVTLFLVGCSEDDVEIIKAHVAG